YLTNNLFDKVLDLFEKIPLKPNEVLYSIFYNAYAALSNEKLFEWEKNTLIQCQTYISMILF
ncbi:unnamed protein product, partial [Rotaria sp. Silwood2]